MVLWPLPACPVLFKIDSEIKKQLIYPTRITIYNQEPRSLACTRAEQSTTGSIKFRLAWSENSETPSKWDMHDSVSSPMFYKDQFLQEKKSLCG
jgi:hypothetical protein